MIHLSGILVVTDPGCMGLCRSELESLAGVDVHHADRPTGRLIVVLESATLEDQQAGLRRIQELPTVRMAALVEHRVDALVADESEAAEPVTLEAEARKR